MTTVFVAGSITIKHLDDTFRERLSTVAKKGFRVLVGDASGADSSIQSELLSSGHQNVVVYYVGPAPRNNIGQWTAQNVESFEEPGSRAFFTAKDRKMASDADYGLMIWDKKSTGTLSNVIELLRLKRKTAVYLNKDKIFFDVKNIDDLKNLTSRMSDGAKEQADRKIHLSKLISTLENEQYTLSL